MIQILLVDDHPLVGEGTKLIIENEKDMKVHFETSSMKALELLKMNTFDIMLFDLQMPEMDGIELTQKAIKEVPDANILIYSDEELLPNFNLFMKSGATGFVPKSATKDQLIRAIRCALNGEIVLPFSVLKQLYENQGLLIQTIGYKEISLNEKEMKIINELVKGKKNRDIAQDLFMGQRSLEYSLTNIFQKLGVKTRIEAVVKVKELKLVD